MSSIKDTMIFRSAPECEEIYQELLDAPATGWLINHTRAVKIVFLYEVTCDDAEAAACIMKVRQPYRQLLAGSGNPADFVVCVFGYHAEGKSRNWLKILILHELMHIDYLFKLRDHDVKDFRLLIKQYGLDWADDNELPDICKLPPTI